jgi:ATP/maltotriose-dependent transcriptional regulator MalT
MTRRARRGFHFESRSRGRSLGPQRNRFAAKKVPGPAEDLAPALIATRMTAPPLTGMIDRLRLEPLSPGHVEGRLWVLRAPAGYGKTVLAGQWFAWMSRQGNAAAWITARPDITTAAALAGYIEAALDARDRANRSEAIMASSRPDRILPRMVALLASRAPVTLFIDGADQLGTTAAGLLADLLLEAPASTRFVLTMRREPTFPCGGLRTRKALVELDAEALRFSDDEAAALFDGSDPVLVMWKDGRRDWACWRSTHAAPGRRSTPIWKRK